MIKFTLLLALSSLALLSSCKKNQFCRCLDGELNEIKFDRVDPNSDDCEGMSMPEHDVKCTIIIPS